MNNGNKQTLDDLRQENRRLRMILEGMTRVGVGKGALVEVYIGPLPDGRSFVSVVVCRADTDEREFMRSMDEGIRELVQLLGGTYDPAKIKRQGVTAQDPGGGDGQ